MQKICHKNNVSPCQKLYICPVLLNYYSILVQNSYVQNKIIKLVQSYYKFLNPPHYTQVLDVPKKIYTVNRYYRHDAQYQIENNMVK